MATDNRPQHGEQILYCQQCGIALGICTARRLSLGGVAIHESVKLTCSKCSGARIWKPSVITLTGRPT